MTQGLNGALRSAQHALKARGLEFYSADSLYEEAKSVAPGCRQVTRRKVLRALTRRQKKSRLRWLRALEQSGQERR